MPFAKLSSKAVLPALLLGAALFALTARPVSAQSFGRNKVQFDKFEFRILETDHFDFHFYPEEAEAVEDAARMGERWYERFARTFQHEFEESKPVILYADHPDFQQTNTLSGFIGEGTGGVTESLKNRVIMPLTGSYWDTDHVLGHELVHAFQYNIAQSRRGGGLQGLIALPLWLVEGMAEYLSVGRDDPLTAMWIRDAIRRDDLPTIRQMTRESRFFPYRFGQALWAYIGGTYGDDAIVQIYRRSLQVGFDGAIEQVLGLSSDTLSIRWKEAVSGEYLPLLEGRDAPKDQGKLILAPSTGSGEVNISPAISPDGRYVAFLSEKDLFSVDLFVAETETGRIVRKLSSAESDPHIDALRYIDSSGTWSPDSRFFAYSAFSGGDNQLVIVHAENGVIDRRIDVGNGIGAISNPAWSPDGRHIAFSGSVGGISDLFLYDLESGEVIRLTNDKFADLQPTWSPDGRTLAFTSDRGPETDFERLTYSAFQLSLLDIRSGQVEVVPVFGNVKHINPQFDGNGEAIYFISDQDGFSDLYEVRLTDGVVHRLTNLATGVSGHTYLAPAMSVSQTGRVVYTVFDELQFHIYADDIEHSHPTITAEGDASDNPGRRLPPADPDRFSRVATYLADHDTGLMPSGTWSAGAADSYRSGLTLDYVGQPSIGVGADDYGNYIGGGVSAYFSDMLGNKILGAAVQAQGTFKDIGGQLFYADLGNRWNWGVGVGRIPYLLGYYGLGVDTIQGQAYDYIGQTRYRIFVSSASGMVSYPFSTTQRMEFGLGATRYSYDIELDKFYLNAFGQIISVAREQRDQDEPDPLNLVQASAAFVGDNSYFGLASPVRGGRYRFEVERTQGTVDFTTVTGDIRRYLQPRTNLTFAFRALHYGRYGFGEADQSQDGFGILNPLFLGFESLVRGYAWESFDTNECSAGQSAQDSCPTLNRLFGQKLAVANAEIRVPFIGVERYGVIDFPYLPTELVLFADAGLAWTDGDEPVLELSRSSTARVPVFATGASARMNILGMLVLEAYYAYPWQRPEKGGHWGFQIAPGW